MSENIDSIIEGALYQEIKSLKDGKSIVMDTKTERLYYKKILSYYSVPVFRYLKEHTNKCIPQIKVFWKEEGNLVVIEEFIQGRTLDELLDKSVESEGTGIPNEKAKLAHTTSEMSKDLITFDEKKRILLEICDGLMFLHSAKPPIIHRDIKATNIMIADDGCVKIIDYDAAKQYLGDKSKDTVLIGTQGIAAPEQYGFGQSDERTDIYALGKLVERMLPDSSHARDIVEKATRLEPDKRYKSVKEMKSQIEKLWDPSISDAAHFLQKVKEHVKSRGFKIRLVLVVLVLAAGLGVHLSRERIREQIEVKKQKEIAAQAKKAEEERKEKIREEYITNANESIELYKKRGYYTYAQAAFVNTEKVREEGLDNGELTESLKQQVLKDADKKIEEGDFAKANELYNAIERGAPRFADDVKEQRKKLAFSEIRYYLDNKEYDKIDGAIKHLTVIENYGDDIKQTIYDIGKELIDGGAYEEAIDTFLNIEDYKDAKDKINEARYEYVKAHIGNPDGSSRLYMDFLKKEGYPGLDKINAIYDWSIEISKITYWGGYNLPCGGINAVLHGGEIGEKISIKYEISDENGNKDVVYSRETLAERKSITTFSSEHFTGDFLAHTYHINAYDDEGNFMGSYDGKIEEK